MELKGASMWRRLGLALLSPLQVVRFVHARRLGHRLGLQNYQVNHLHTADALLSLSGKRVLEVGGSLPSRMVIDHYKCRSWTCVDSRTEYTAELDFDLGAPADSVSSAGADRAGTWSFLDGRFEQVATTLTGPFDVIYSSAVLEHVRELSACLTQMRRLLAPGGAMFHAVGPIWSGPSGYHVYPSYFRKHGPTAGVQVVDALGPWIHLVKTPEQMLAHLTEFVEAPLAQDAVESIYRSPRLSRRVFDEYLAAFDDAGLQIAWLHKWKKPVRNAQTLRALRATGVDTANYRFDTFWTVLTPR
jgi:SAM-dependent methyltransferase